MKHQPERTCIGCRGIFQKDHVVRVVAAPQGIVIDYREKLQGRAAYVCPTRDCIEKALTRENLSRAFRSKVQPPAVDGFAGMLADSITARVRSLVAMSAKAGKLAAGYSAVLDALTKGRVELLLYAADIADGTREKLQGEAGRSCRETTFFTRDEMGSMLSRELVGVVAFLDKGLADAAWRESERLKGLINSH